ncbi:MAG: electron transfer flavoprotein subunit beta/FixA family protein [Proteobacteria bacterium]|nr:electron transfer flavoprotein subunit beta/FixA family protein [Pseudomonadota bacterium]MBU1387173.1 electron transfer flavoprotein subunit beta/FixA family protein [Pseudomonadota bacterium]MBU1541509.1 electron transfer flavoprotein subunit beta/FixA family protein [Pseudomonadota bacterium]MBU2431133.1 electron transfer flavoprotein subunit beta/FixA family protein [Pseudomonadota bacterium]MBU2482140.1 electron transfer flavoprotein subunit beta/FixA family protein [Pseudomonadota bact
MKLLVCIKQVMESASQLKIHSDGKRLCTFESTRYEMNPYDESAVEEAILIKETVDNTHIDVITVGPSHAEDVLRRALGMGADDGIHIIDNSNDFCPPIRIASWISAFAKDRAYDLILTGIMSNDEMNAQTGPMIARILGWPCATAVIKEDLSSDRKSIAIQREIEGGARDVFDISLPCVLTIQTGINTPRYPSLSKVLRAKKKTFTTIEASQLETLRPEAVLDRLVLPQKTAQGIVLEGSALDKSQTLLDILESKGLL